MLELRSRLDACLFFPALLDALEAGNDTRKWHETFKCVQRSYKRGRIFHDGCFLLIFVLIYLFFSFR